MSATLTLADIPDDLYQRLERSAEKHGRSVNEEAIVALTAALQAPGDVVKRPFDGSTDSPSTSSSTSFHMGQDHESKRQDS